MNSSKATLSLPFLYFATFSLFTTEAPLSTSQKWTFMVYMEAANDLEIFAPRNIRQMQQVGSNENITIVVQHNTYEKEQYQSKTFLVQKGEKQLLKKHSSITHTGEKNLVDFCCDTITTYPADHYALIFWNHGTGVIEPVLRSALSSSELFAIQNSSDFFEKDGQGFTPLQTTSKKRTNQHYKGICFDDESGKFLSEKQMQRALRTICSTSLQNKKFDLIGFDACLMSMIEVALALEPYAHTMVASQDVERGTGWNYYHVLAPFLTGALSPQEFGKQIVDAYHKVYQRIADYTLSSVLLENLQELVNSVSTIATSLQKLLQSDNKRLKLSVKVSRNKHLCTYFDEPEFIDLHHFLRNLHANLKQIPSCPLADEAKQELVRAQNLIETIVYANTTGTAYPQAKGLSIYFPEHAIHSSYRRCCFATQTKWYAFLKAYVSAYKK